MDKFNDFSRYKNNELRSYFVKKELELYLKEKDKKKDLAKNPINANIFSAIMTASIWTAKTNTDENTLKSLIDKTEIFYKSQFSSEINLDWFYYPLTVFFAFSLYLVFYWIYFSVVIPMISYLKRLNLKRKNSKGIIDIEKFKSQEETTNKYYLDKFKYEVVNQISLALSIITYVDKTSDTFENTKNKFYVNEAFHYLNNSLTVLESEIISSSFIDKILSPTFYEINTNRVSELIELAENLSDNIKAFWKENSQYKYDYEIKNINELIHNIKIAIE